MDAQERLRELQAKKVLTPGEKLEVRHLIEMKYKLRIVSVGSDSWDLEALARSALEVDAERKRAEDLSQGQ